MWHVTGDVCSCEIQRGDRRSDLYLFGKVLAMHMGTRTNITSCTPPMPMCGKAFAGRKEGVWFISGVGTPTVKHSRQIQPKVIHRGVL
jgi:hypothetical protein